MMSVSPLPLVLASGSRYRAELLKKLGLDFITHASNIDESPLAGESADTLALRLAKAKADAAATHYAQHWIIGSDQVAVCDGTLLEKPGSRHQAIEQLDVQSGRSVTFHTSICVLDSRSGRCVSDMDLCTVQFKILDRQQIERYVDAEPSFDCVGSFKSEGYGIVLFDKIITEDPNALVGLPLIKLTRLFAQMGFVLP